MPPTLARLRTLLACAFVVPLVFAAELRAAGVITGQVVNGLTGQPVPDARVALDGDAAATATAGVDGVFRLGAPAGSHTLTIGKPGFEAQKVTGVEVVEGRAASFSVVLMPVEVTAEHAAEAAAFAEEVTVTAAEATVSTEAALLAERRTAVQISDSIGSEEMSATVGSDAASVLKRVTGVSLQEDRYVYVRGLGDRYSNTTLNGSRIPSTEFEKKVVPLDLFPTAMLDRITVSKSYTVDSPGDFAAGYVDLRTLSFPATQMLQLGFNLNHNSITTGEPLLTYEGGLDSRGGGGQSLPSSIPGRPLFPRTPFRADGFTQEELNAFGRDLVGAWTPTDSDEASPEMGFKLSYGNTFGRLGLILSADYDNEFETRPEEFTIYSLSGGELVPRNDYDIHYGEETVRQSALANFAYELSGNHRLTFRSIYTDLATAEGRRLDGFYEDVGTDIRDRRVSYQEQEVISGQLGGEHFLSAVGSGGSLLEWRASASEATTAEDRRQVIYVEDNGEFRLTDLGQSGFMYFNDLEDRLTDTSAHWTTFISGARVNGGVKGGLAWTHNERDFAGRRFRYDQRAIRNVDLTLSPEELFVPENIGTVFVLEDITRVTDTYEGDHEVGAAYLQGDIGWGPWRVIAGLRAEDSTIEVTTINRLTPTADPQLTVLEDSDLLPALNLVYAVTPQQNLRLAASQTVNRPDFRELAPFNYIHVVGGFEVEGNPELVSASIRSFDLRWEWFPRGSEVVAASVFYKDFEDPIEQVLLSGAQRVETFRNVDAAESYGVELELRRDLGSLTEALENLSVLLNYTWIESQLQIDPAETALTNPDRPLAGQPEQVGNAALEWLPLPSTELRFLYNFIGEKVSRGGILGIPDVIEEPYSSFDLLWRQGLDRLVSGLSFQISGENLADTDREWTQGGETWRRYEPGKTYRLSFTYEPF